MKRKLLKQITNEWHSNLWLAVELLVVSVVMWFITDFLAMQFIRLSIPMGIETDNCFLADINSVPADSPDYDPADTTLTTYAENQRVIIARLRANPDIEGVALVSRQSVPYTQNTSSLTLKEVESSDSILTPYAPVRKVSPDYLRLFKVRGARGETPDELAEMLANGEWLLAQNQFVYTRYQANDTTLTDEYWVNEYRKALTSDKSYLIGKKFINTANWANDTLPHRIGAIIQPIKRHEYEVPNGGVIMLLDERVDNDVLNAQLVLRVKPGKTPDIADKLLAQSTTLYRSGNMYLSTVTPFDTMRSGVQADDASVVRNFVVIMFFLMVSLFLGLLGTFWFRTQQRVSEIAIRIVNGATRRSIFRRLAAEGVLLLTLATPPAILIDWLLCHYEISPCIYGWDYFDPLTFFITVSATYILMALMIVLGIWFPAYRAMHVEPAIALKDE